MNRMVSIRVVKTITEVNKVDWNGLAGENVLMSHGWLRTIEETRLVPSNRLYLLAEDTGRLVGGAVLEYSGPDRFDQLLFGRLANRTARLGISFGPVLDAHPYRSYGKAFLVEAGADSSGRKNIIRALYSEMERLTGIADGSIGFSKLMENEPELAELLKEEGFLRFTTSPLNYIDIKWSSFSGYREYIAGFSRNMESNIRKEMNKNRRVGVEIRAVEEVAECEDRLVQLAEMNRMKHNNLPFPFRRDFFSRLKEYMGGNAVIYGAFKKGELMGVALQLKTNRTAYSPIVGVDHDLSGNDATYFNLCYYKPIADAIENKIGRIYFGFGMYELKAKRGCRFLPVHVYFRSNRKWRNVAARSWMSVHSAWWARKSPYNRMVGGDPPPPTETR
jgi:predicted N-acyltransferase